MGAIIDGNALSKKIREEVAGEIAQHSLRPKLAVVLVGDDPASHTYVSMKEKACRATGVLSVVHRLGLEVTQAEVLALIADLNHDNSVHGILVQLPLPRHLDPMAVYSMVKPEKDVDGLHPLNVGRLNLGLPGAVVACTPAGVMEMLKSINYTLKGKHVVVAGRSNIVGKPMTSLVLHANATVTVVHSYTVNLTYHTRQADVLIAAVGKRDLITADMVKPGAVVIDVGTNKVGNKLVGDVDFTGVKEVASYITPVPGGVGPMTIAMLIKNTLQAAKMQHG